MYKTLLLLTAVAVLLTEGCLITNCPRGGKRSVGPLDPECRRCGPGLAGRCLGRAVCCGPRIGCLVGTPSVLNQCSAEAGSAGVRGARRCSSGFCLSDGVCCSPSGCKLDMSCEMEESTDVCSLAQGQQIY